MIEFGNQELKPVMTHAIKFANVESGQEMLVQVYDKYPQMGDVHVEGRRYVEVSIEMFMFLLQAQGWNPVNPNAETKEAE